MKLNQIIKRTMDIFAAQADKMIEDALHESFPLSSTIDEFYMKFHQINESYSQKLLNHYVGINQILGIMEEGFTDKEKQRSDIFNKMDLLEKQYHKYRDIISNIFYDLEQKGLKQFP